MSAAKSTLKCLIIVSVMLGLLMSAGCGGTEEKDRMTALLQDFNKHLDEYAAAVSKADSGKKEEIGAKLEALKTEWTLLEESTGDKITPQAMEKFEREFKAVWQKYASLSGKS